MHFCIGKYQSVPRLLAMIVGHILGSYVARVLHSVRVNNVDRVLKGRGINIPYH